MWFFFTWPYTTAVRRVLLTSLVFIEKMQGVTVRAICH